MSDEIPNAMSSGGRSLGAVLKHNIIKVAVTLLVLTTLSVFLRLWAKMRTGKRKFGVDDASMFTSWVCCPVCPTRRRFTEIVILVILHFVMRYRNYTRKHRAPYTRSYIAGSKQVFASKPSSFIARGHTTDLTFSQVLTLGEVVFMLTTICLKTALMLFYRQFVWKSWQRNAIILAGACSIILSIGALFLSLFQCGNLSHMAQKQLMGQCIGRSKFVPLLYLHGATGAVTDWAFALLPISVLIKSSLAPHIKLSVCVLLLLGVTGSVAACFRTAYVYGVWFEPIFLNPSHQPKFYDHVAPEIVLALTELGFGISAASLACLQPLLRMFVHKARNWFQHQRHLCSWASSGNSTAAVKSHVELLPNAELKGRKQGNTAICKPPVVVQTHEASSSQNPLPQPAVSKHDTTSKVGGTGGNRKLSLSRWKASLGILPTLGSVTEIDIEPHQQPEQTGKFRGPVGILPRIATYIDENEYEEPVASSARTIAKEDGLDQHQRQRTHSKTLTV